MTQSQATAEVFYTAFQALKKSEREAFINKLLEDEKLAVFKSIQAGIKEVKESKKSGRKLQKLSDYIKVCCK